MKTLSTILVGLTLSVSAYATTSSESIQRLMEDTQAGSLLNVEKMSGGYTGTCYVTHKKHIFSAVEEYITVAKEALYVGKFINADDKSVDLAVSTEQTHGDVTIPKKLAFLLKGDAKGLKFIKDFVWNGQTGIDNNYGRISKSDDYFFNYISKVEGNVLTVSTERLYDCRGEANKLCSPPILPACSNGRDENGLQIYEGCLRKDEQTSYKQISDKTIISHRTGAQIGAPSNNYSFYLPEVSTYCVWEKK